MSNFRYKYGRCKCMVGGGNCDRDTKARYCAICTRSCQPHNKWAKMWKKKRG